MKKAVYFQKNTTKRTFEKGRIPIETEFTQVYDTFQEIIFQIKSPTAIKLLFWLLVNEANKRNAFITDSEVFTRFADELNKRGDSITRSTFDRAVHMLTKIGAITKVGTGHYYFNPHLFWRGTRPAREALLRDEARDNTLLSINPTHGLPPVVAYSNADSVAAVNFIDELK